MLLEASPFRSRRGGALADEEFGAESLGFGALAAEPIHQRPVVGPQLLGQQANVVLGFCIHNSAEYRGQVVSRRLVLDVASIGSNAPSF